MTIIKAEDTLTACNLVIESNDPIKLEKFIDSLDVENLNLRTAALCYLKLKKYADEGDSDILDHKNCKLILNRCHSYIKEIINKDESRKAIFNTEFCFDVTTEKDLEFLIYLSFEPKLKKLNINFSDFLNKKKQVFLELQNLDKITNLTICNLKLKPKNGLKLEGLTSLAFVGFYECSGISVNMLQPFELTDIVFHDTSLVDLNKVKEFNWSKLADVELRKSSTLYANELKRIFTNADFHITK